MLVGYFSPHTLFLSLVRGLRSLRIPVKLGCSWLLEGRHMWYHYIKPGLLWVRREATSTTYIIIILLQIPSTETTIDLGVTRFGCRECWGLNQV